MLLPAPSLVPLGLVALSLFCASLYVLAAMGHFPRRTRQEALLRGAGPIVLWGSIIVAIVSAAISLVAAWSLLPGPAAIIAGGLAVLFAPLVLQYFSDDFVDGMGALTWFAGAQFLLAVILLWYLGR